MSCNFVVKNKTTIGMGPNPAGTTGSPRGWRTHTLIGVEGVARAGVNVTGC